MVFRWKHEGDSEQIYWKEISVAQFNCLLILLLDHIDAHSDLRSGGPKLKDTQSYPIRFCSRIAEYFKKYCVESQPY